MIVGRIVVLALFVITFWVNGPYKDARTFAATLTLLSLAVLGFFCCEAAEHIAKAIRNRR